MKHASLVLCFLLLSTSVFAIKPLQWEVKKDSWSSNDEVYFQEFVAKIGEAREEGKCGTLAECITNKDANPFFYNLNPESMKDIYSDCADLPFILRAYFAWMNDLPFSFPNNIKKNMTDKKLEDLKLRLAELQEYHDSGKPSFFEKMKLKVKISSAKRAIKKRLKKIKKQDIRYSTNGNVIAGRYIVKTGDSFNRIARRVIESISTAIYRVNPTLNEGTRNFKDFYPTDINRDSIRPGTVLYDPAGHIAVVYKVTNNGRIFLIDAHPDNSLTRIAYGEKFSRSSLKRSAGFMNWRPIEVYGNSISSTPNSELENFSLIQFQGTNNSSNYRKAKFEFDNEQVEYIDFIRKSLSIGNLKYDPLDEFKFGLSELCITAKDRAESVERAIKAKLHTKEHPSKLPENIYGTTGEWENFSTPSRDARFKASVRELKKAVSSYIEMFNRGTDKLDYSGSDLEGELLEIYTNITNSCVITVSQNATINLDYIIENIYKLSFDPYHSIKLRWGIKDKSSSKTKLDWYYAEQDLRNRIDRDYSLNTNFSLSELKSNKSRVAQEDISIRSIFK